MALTKADPGPGRARLVAHSPAFLPQDYSPLRKPRFGWRARPANFHENFEKRALFYDVFWHANGKKLLLVGPPPRNLLAMLKRASYTIKGVKGHFKPRFFISQSVMIIALDGVPRNADILHVGLDDLEFMLPIRENLSDELAGRRVLFTMSKNNPLPWITAWADYHQRFQDVDAIVLIDNGSSAYTVAEIARALEKTRIEEIIIVSWPYIYGAIDGAVIFTPYWTHFLQIAGLSLILRRFATRAEGILNCDIDELATHRTERTIFSALKNTPQGLLAMRGTWIEAYPGTGEKSDHRNFYYRLSDPQERLCRSRKWILDPKRAWVQNLDVHPYMHWINRRPQGSKSMPKDAYYWHFKGINTNWKVKRNKVAAGQDQAQQAHSMEPDPELQEVFSRWSDGKKDQP